MNKQFDVLIIGCGLAGLSAAYAAAEKGRRVCILSKSSDIEESNSRYAQGGIVAHGIDDSPELLAKDIDNAGSNITYREAIELLAKNGPDLVEDILVNKVKVPFSSDEKGVLHRTMEGAHSTRRILHVEDRTGQAIISSFLAYLRNNNNITFLSGRTAIDLISNTHNSADYQQKYHPTRILGSYVLNNGTGEIEPYFASSVILAAGGVGNLFQHTSNPVIATGDGIAMAYRAGAEVINSEFMQFHPTLLFHKDIKRFLISESLRGEGARLVNKRGEFFMPKYDAVYKDLSSRDMVSRAIFKEMEITDSDYVFLDTSGMKDIDMASRFPLIQQTCRKGGIDIQNELIPVVPAAHYFCGGIKVDLDGQTHIPGLYAAGENACTGVHGANRLASVSLLEALYFGIRTGQSAALSNYSLNRKLCASIPGWKQPLVEYEFDPVLIHNDLSNIRITMWNYSGIIRTKKRLSRALSDLNYMSHRIEKFYREAAITPQLIELRNAVMTSILIVRAAKGNPCSIGCHYRGD